MKLKITVAQLERPLLLVTNIVDGKHINQNLRSVKFDIVDRNLRLTGATNDIEIEALVGEIDCTENVSLLVAPKQLTDIVRYAPKDAILTLTLAHNRISIETGDDQYQLSCMAAESFPRMKLLDDVPAEELVHCTLPAKQITRMMQSVIHAVAQQDIRQYLNGVLIECIQTTLRLVATDSHRMAIVTEQFSAPLSQEIRRFIVVKRAVNELLRTLAHYPDDMLTVTLCDQTLVATMPGWRLSTKLLNVNYPNYEQVIPPVDEEYFICNNKDIIQAIKKTAIIGEQNRGLQLSLAGGQLVCESHNLDTGETARTVISVEANVTQVSLAFNSKFLADVTSILDQDAKLIFYCSDKQPSVLICAQNNPSRRFVIMPIKI